MTSLSDPRFADKAVLAADLIAIYEGTRDARIPNPNSKTGDYYRPTRFLNGVRAAHESENEDVVQKVAMLLRGDTTGFDLIADAGRPDLLVENLVLDQSRPYYDLFSKRTRELARERLARHGFARTSRSDRELVAAEQVRPDAPPQPDKAALNELATQSFILTWNPALWSWNPDHLSRWSIGLRRGGVTPGDRVYLLRQHDHRGIVASGVLASEVWEGPHWDGSGNRTTFVTVDWDTIIDPIGTPAGGLSTDDLKEQIPEVNWDRLQGSGAQVPAIAATRLEALWRSHASEPALLVSPEEIGAAERFPEGSVTQVTVNRYERNRTARDLCVDYWNPNCFVCGMNFGDEYGEYGQGFIHVHHLRDLASIGSEYEVDPVNDLRPVCPNCHAMLHQKGAPPIDEMRAQRYPNTP